MSEETKADEISEQMRIKKLQREAKRSVIALSKFTNALEDMSANEQRAAIKWLADRYLGIEWENDKHFMVRSHYSR
jgi:hypothetical protein